MEITSTQNPKLKLVKSLQDKKWRKETSLFLVEGGNIVKDMPDSVEVEFFLATIDKAEEFMWLTDKFKAPLYMVNNDMFKSVSDTVSPFGIIAVAKQLTNNYTITDSSAILLDGVSDSGNLGTIIRTASACGIKDVYLLDCADVFSPKVVRATMGGIFRINIHVVNENQAFELAEKLNSVCLDMGGESFLNDKKQNVLLVAGGEAHGVRESLKQTCKSVQSLPMKNEMESLNVAVALGVCMYHIN